MIDAVLPKKLTGLQAAQGVDGCGVSSTVVLNLNEESLAPICNLLYVAPEDTYIRTYVHMVHTHSTQWETAVELDIQYVQTYVHKYICIHTRTRLQ